MKSFLKFVFILSLIFAQRAHAETYRRLVNFEWEPIEGATAYELELTQSTTQKVFSFKIKDSAWNGRLPSGNYVMRIRVLDRRSVPGTWSPPSDFLVELEKVKMLSPTHLQQISSKEEETESVTFKWEPVGGATGYKFELVSSDGKITKSEDLKETQYTLKLSVAQNYQWKVSAYNDNNMKSEAASEANFAILGNKLETPAITKPENQFVRDLKWTRPNHTEKYNLALSRYNQKEKTWEKFKEYLDYSDETIPFDAKWPGGKWKLSIRGKAQGRQSSDIATEIFPVRNGNRSPAAEYTSEIRKSVDRVSGWYGIASYLVTIVDYRATVYDVGSDLPLPVIGGTGRIGAGWFGDKTPWGFLGIVDLSGITTTQRTLTFSSAELSAVYKVNQGDRNEVRIQSGLFYKQLPVISSTQAGTNNADGFDSISTLGPHVGAEYWWPMTPKFGLQTNAHLYVSMIKLQTPNGENVGPSFSAQFGLLGSYRYSQRLTGLAGYAYKMDSAKYGISPNSTLSSSASYNEVKLTGHYLNFFAEYAF